MDLNSLVSTLRSNLQGYSDVNANDDLNTAASKLQTRAAVVDALRKKAMAQPDMGSMVGKFYVPNFAGFGQQIAANMNLGGEQAGLEQAVAANQQNQIAAAQAALAQQPEHPGDQSAGPPIPGQIQDQQQGQFATQLMQNPMTAEVGKKILAKALSGGFAEDMQTREEKVQDRADQNQFRKDYLKLQQAGQADLADKRLQGQIAVLEKKAALNPKGLSQKDYVSLTDKLGSRLDKEGKKWGDLVDAVDQISSLYSKPLDQFNASDDYNLVYAYNHIMDPGSVVREGEFDNTLRMNPIVQQARLKLGSLVDGKQNFTPETRKMMKDTVDLYSKPIRDRLYALSDNYAQQAHNSGINPNFVVTKANWRNPNSAALYQDSADPVSAGDGTTSVAPNLTPMPTSYKDTQWNDIESKVSPQYADKLKSIRLNGERSNSDQKSSADARTPYQITAKTRDLIRSKYGFDPWDGPENAVRGAEIVLKDGLQKYGGDERKALDHYSGGAKGYADRVLKGATEEHAKQVEKATKPLVQSGWSSGGVSIEKAD